jgi:hypothetical protein
MEQARLPLKDCCRIVKKKSEHKGGNVLLECCIQRKYSLFAFSALIGVISIQSDFMSAQPDIKYKAQCLCAVLQA